MVAIAESIREQWERESEARELAELERLARLLMALSGRGSASLPR